MDDARRDKARLTGDIASNSIASNDIASNDIASNRTASGWRRLAIVPIDEGAIPAVHLAQSGRAGLGQPGAVLELWLVEVNRVGADGRAAPSPSLTFGETRRGSSRLQRVSPTSPREPIDRAVCRALELMQGDARRRWSVESLARAVGLSRAAFARRFAAARGQGPIAYLAELRLSHAARLLIEGDTSLSEVAAFVGYDSEFAFSRAFKRQHGLPPALFRRQHRLGSGPRCLALAA